MIKIKELTKKYGKDLVIDNITVEFKKGEIVGLIGPSGSGKSTVLRCIAGVEPKTSGDIILADKCRVGMVFQNFNLFNNMTVLKNLCYPQMKVLHRNYGEAEGIAMKVLKKVNMMELFERYPSTLSGGQKQRVAIARTLCIDPSIILFDEPTAALDPENVSGVLDVIRDIANDSVSMIIVSHELRFIKAVANRVIFMDRGRIIADQSKDDFFHNPQDDRVKAFISSLLIY